MELKIPPPLVAALCAAFMREISKKFNRATLNSGRTGPLAMLVLIIGSVISLSAIVLFRKTRTTVNAMKPRNAKRLVDSGMYRFSRNPMYLGVLLILTSLAIWLENILNLAVLLFFVWYMTKFQIVPEEKVLEELFREQFEAYRAKVRRWI
ncbi:methyltransferase family protein [Candidatus Riflebacteria bacterium]